VVTVADGEGVRQRVVVGQVGTGVVAHREQPGTGALVLGRGVGADERVHGATAAAEVLGQPVVGQVGGALAEARRRVEVEGELAADRMTAGVARVGLGERPQTVAGMVIEATHPLVAAEVVVERPVLLHEEDHVFDGAQVGAGRTGRGGRRDGGR